MTLDYLQPSCKQQKTSGHQKAGTPQNEKTVILSLISSQFPPQLLRRIAFCAVLVGYSISSPGIDLVTISRNGQDTSLEGEIVVEAQDGGLMFRATDGRIWMIQPDEIKSKSSNSKKFEGITPARMGQNVIEELKDSDGQFRSLKSNDLVVVYNTSPAYASWVKGIYLRLTVAFKNFWKNKGLELESPDVPLCVIIFRSKSEFDAYSKRTLGSIQGNALAYYNVQSNRVIMYDLTGVAQVGGKRVSSSAQLNSILRQPAAEAMVATIVHEAVHQISYNSGLQNRFGPYPFWLNEGMAMFFEVPDLKSKRGWHGIGKVNNVRLNQIKLMIRGETTQFFDNILRNDTRFREADQLLNAYAESWALNFYLIQREPKKYVAYLKEIKEMTPLSEPTPEERIALFQKHFGSIEHIKTECFNFILK